MLRKHRTDQKAEKLQAANQWQESGLVFITEFGGTVDPRDLLRVAEAAAEKARAEGVGVHALRHSAAVGWLEARGYISKPSPTCSDTRRLPSRAMCTGTPATTPHAQRWTGGVGRSNCDRKMISFGATVYVP